MARIKTYVIDNIISDNDIIIGSDFDNSLQTKNFQVSNLRQYMLSGLEPEIGGNLKITTIVDNESEYETPEDYFNNADPNIIVLHYEIVFLILNGRTFIFRKNNDIYGVGETQVISSDFTEIDITSVINANLQDLDSVLTEGNESLLDAYIGSLYLYNPHVMSGNGHVSITGNKNRVNFFDNEGVELGYVTQDTLRLNDLSTIFSFQIKKPSELVDNRTATFQDASGTVAYLSDIPEVNVVDIVAGDNISVTEDEGVFTINALGNQGPSIETIQLRNSLSNTTYFDSEDCVFDYDEITSPINSIRIVFDENVSYGTVFPNETILGRALFYYQNGSIEYLDLIKEDSNVSSNYIQFGIPFSEYWSLFGNSDGNKLTGVSFSLKPKVVKSTADNVYFDGNVSNFFVKFITDVEPFNQSPTIANEKNTTTNTITAKNVPLNLAYDINISKSGRMVTINGSITNTSIDDIESVSEDANFFFEIVSSSYLVNTLETFPFFCYGTGINTYVFFINNKLYCRDIPSGEQLYFNITYFTQN